MSQIIPFPETASPQIVRTLLEEGAALAGNLRREETSDDSLLDAYSKTIAAVVNRVAPSVVNIRLRSAERGPGSGSGFIIARD